VCAFTGGHLNKTAKMVNVITVVKRIIFSICFILLMISLNAFGQEPVLIPSHTDGADFGFLTSEIRTLKNELESSQLNRIALQQIGNTNQAFIKQISNNEPNLAKLYQDGNQNYFHFEQIGNSNALDIVQLGNDNIYSGIHAGDHIINKVIQRGNENYIDQTLKADVLYFQINQFGHGHVLIQEETSGNIGYKVTQKGDVGMKITIKQGNIYK
jgi:hypothetical protein